MVIAAILTVAALTGIFSTNPMAACAEGDDGRDSSETETEQKLKQKNVGSDESFNDNCSGNFIDSNFDAAACGPT
jgi:hypothetical protein